MTRSTPRPITEVTAIDVQVDTYLRAAGGVFRMRSRTRTPVRRPTACFADGDRWFVKPSTDSSIVESLRRALRLNSVVQHPALPRLHNSFSIPGGMALVYAWAPGEVLNDPRYTPEQRQHDPTHPHVRFRSLPIDRILGRARHRLRRAPAPGRARVRRVRLLRRLHNLRLPDLSDLPLRPRRVPPWPVRARHGPRLWVDPLHGSRRVPTRRGDRPGDQRVQPVSGRDRAPRRRDGVDGCLEGYGSHAQGSRASHSCRPNASLPIGGGVR